MAVNELYYKGKVYARIRSAKCNKSESISLSTLPVDTLTATVVDERHWDNLLGYSGDRFPFTIDGLPVVSKLSSERLDVYDYGTPVIYKHDGNLVGKFYLESIEQVSKWDWEFKCVSDMGLLVSSDHWGGLYQGIKAKVVIADIINGLIPYTLDPSLEDVEIWGRLKKSSRRNNLRDVLYAIGAQVTRDENGDSVFAPYKADIQPYTIYPSSFYKDGGKIANGTPATKAILTEHAFAQRDTDVTATLFDGEVQGEDIVTPNGLKVNGAIIEFKEPMYDLAVQGTTIVESGVNYAVLATSPYASLTGKQYTHTQRTLSRESNVKGVPNEVKSSSCELVNIRNSVSIADRLIAFYGYAKEVTMDLVLTTQKPGDYVTFTDPYGNPATGYIKSLQMEMSKEIKAKAVVTCGFIPPIDKPMYLHHEIISTNQDWTVPDGVTSVRVVLIGGGTGGYTGGAGKPGGSTAKTRTGSDNDWNTRYAYRDPSKGGDGGVAGPGGPGGKVLATAISVTPGQTFPITIGIGGMGSPATESVEPVIGLPGSATTFGSLTSDSGVVIPGGYLEEITGVTYAKEGGTGIPGGDGVGVDLSNESNGEGWSPIKVPPGITFGGVTYSPGQDQKSTLINSGEQVIGSGTVNGQPYTDTKHWGSQRGFGGGAAVGANGHSSGTQSRIGANGATPNKLPSAQTNPGDGGNGGYGGGGGGGFGGYGEQLIRGGPRGSLPSGSISTGSNSTPGSGGKGNSGGQGGPGLVLLYYYSPEPDE